MNRENLLTVLTIVAGLIGVFLVYNYRYNQGYNHGSLDGFVEGNQTEYQVGVVLGYDDGMEQGETIGMKMGDKIGYDSGLITGYENGYLDGEESGYIESYNMWFETGSSEGYLSGVLEGSKNYIIRDPTYQEAIAFIRSDQTDTLASNGGIHFYISKFRESAYSHGYRCIWVTVEIEGEDGYFNFCGFDTTDNGLIYFDCCNDRLIDLEIGEPSLKPSFNGDVVVIKLIA